MVLRWLINGHRGSALQLNLLQHLKHLPHYMCCSHRNPKLFIVTDNHLELRTFFFQNVLTRHLEPDQTSTLRTRGSICEAFLWHQVLVVSTRKGTDICEFAQPGSYTKISMTWYMHACEYMYVYKEVQSVSARKGTDTCEFAQHGFISQKYLWFHIYIYM